MTESRAERPGRSPLPPENFLHPEKGTLPAEIPMGGLGIRDIVDAPRSGVLAFPRISTREVTPRTIDEVAFTVRTRYPQTAARVDKMYTDAAHDYTHGDLSDDGMKRVIGLAGAYNYVRGIQVLQKEDPSQPIPRDTDGIPTGNVRRDTEYATNITLSPSALLQLQETAEIGPKDDVLYLFSGVGGGMLFTAAAQPASIDAVDLYTPVRYDLEGTFDLARREMYAKVPKDLQPQLTRPKFIKADATQLPDFDSATATETGFRKKTYTKVLCHPPYGRESMLLDTMKDIQEGEGFMEWIQSVVSVNEANHGPAQVFSIIPPEWGKALSSYMGGKSMEEAMSDMYNSLKELPYYSDPTNANKLNLEAIRGKLQAMDRLEVKQKISKVFGSPDNKRKDLEEMGMFPLQINVINIPGKQAQK